MAKKLITEKSITSEDTLDIINVYLDAIEINYGLDNDELIFSEVRKLNEVMTAHKFRSDLATLNKLIGENNA